VGRRREVSGGLRLLTSGAAAQDAAMIRSGPLRAASRYGVRIGTDRRPPPAFAGAPADSGAASEQHWTLAYQEAYAQATADAHRARQQAARRLAELHATLAPARLAGGPSATSPGRLTIGQLIAGLSSQLAGSSGASPRDPRPQAEAASRQGR
jgi:hypothetical protein